MTVSIRPVAENDLEQWKSLWLGYADFLDNTVADEITNATFSRMLDVQQPICGFVAHDNSGSLVGFVTYVFHATTFSLTDRCYLEDLFVSSLVRGGGVGRKLVEAVSDAALAAGADKLYWHTEEDNYAGRALYDQLAQKTHIVYSRNF